MKAKRFKGVHELVSSNVTKPGQWEAAFNKDMRELYVHYWSRHTNVGKKSVLTNVIKPNPRKGCSRTFLIPLMMHTKKCLVSVIFLIVI